MQIDLGGVRNIKAVVTQGHAAADMWVIRSQHSRLLACVMIVLAAEVILSQSWRITRTQGAQVDSLHCVSVCCFLCRSRSIASLSQRMV